MVRRRGGRSGRRCGNEAGNDAFIHTVRLEDDARSLELRVVCTLAPAYEIRAVDVQVRAGDVADDVLAGVTRAPRSAHDRRLHASARGPRRAGQRRRAPDRRRDRGGAPRPPGREDPRRRDGGDSGRRRARRIARSISPRGPTSRARASRTARPPKRSSAARAVTPSLAAVVLQPHARCRARVRAPEARAPGPHGRAAAPLLVDARRRARIRRPLRGRPRDRHDRRRRLDGVAPAVPRPLRRAAGAGTRHDRPDRSTRCCGSAARPCSAAKPAARSSSTSPATSSNSWRWDA